MPATEPIPVECLNLDLQNPRLREYLPNGGTPDQILDLMVEHFAIDELVSSILETGFWQQEPMIVMGQECDFTVLEGNRRLAAIKILRSPELREKYALHQADPTKIQRAINTTENITCFLVASRYESWQLIGFKHVNGPQKWNSLAKAAYIFELRQQGLSTADISEQLGDRNRTVERLLRAYSVLLQAESSNTWRRSYRQKNRLAFSHLMTGLEYREISDYIELVENPSDSSNPNARNLDNLGQLLKWLYGDTRDNTPPLFKSQNPGLSNLRDALKSPAGVNELKRSARLDYAVEASRGDSDLFAESLRDSKNGLERSLSKVSSGYRGETEGLNTCVLLVDLAETLLTSVRKRRRAITDEGEN